MDNTNKPDEPPDIRNCKKCGCELVSTNKRKLCEHCRRERAEKWKRRGEWALGIAGAVGLALTRLKGSSASDGAEDPSSQYDGDGMDTTEGKSSSDIGQL